MDIKDIKRLKVGDHVSWYESTTDGKPSGYNMLFVITRINYTRGLVWGRLINSREYWQHNATRLNLAQLGISKDLFSYNAYY
jgi:hypothetical protein